ncbi:MAG: neutral zinc metallopeptidase [Myxococcales bacterium]|nr:neutral zinc metallopeptidase [Myxococcales bacterium]MCB9707913.1 neutral zinc metallopeptidase [Myxococcales bacterium]
MRWKLGRRSGNVVDARSGGRGLRIGGMGSILVLFGALVVWLMGGNPMSVLSLLGSPGAAPQASSSNSQPPPDDPQADFVARILGDTEDTWAELLPREIEVSYEPAKLVLYRDVIQSACGTGSAAMGPFYCPGDRRVYLDLSFFDQLERRFGAPGDFARAYVIAHEVGHHIQTLLGTSQEVRAKQAGLSRAAANKLSVRQELQADCYAGVWAHHAKTQRNLLEPGDLEEGLKAASAIGDDTLQRKTQSTVVPESFTHGSSEQRVSWFRRGFEQGRIAQCDTFTDAKEALAIDG